MENNLIKKAKNALEGNKINISGNEYIVRKVEDEGLNTYSVYTKNKIKPLFTTNSGTIEILIKEGIITIGDDQIEIVDFIPEEKPDESSDIELSNDNTDVEEQKYNNPDYKYYIVSKDDKILTGWEYKEDARENLKETPSSFNAKVLSKKSLGFDPNDNSNWGSSDSRFDDVLQRAKNYYVKYSKDEIRKFLTDYKIPGNAEMSDEYEGNHLTNKQILGVYINCLLKMLEKARNYKLNKTADVLQNEYRLATSAEFNIK